MYTANKDDTVSNLKNTAHNFRNAADDAANDAKRNLNEVANQAGRKVRAFLHTTEDELVHARDAVTTQIRSKPVQSSMIALGAGVILGILLNRR